MCTLLGGYPGTLRAHARLFCSIFISTAVCLIVLAVVFRFTPSARPGGKEGSFDGTPGRRNVGSRAQLQDHRQAENRQVLGGVEACSALAERKRYVCTHYV